MLPSSVLASTTAFHAGFDHLSIHLHSASRNHPTSVVNPAVVETHIAKEVAAGCMVGPITDAIGSQVRVSPIGLVPKITSGQQMKNVCEPVVPSRPQRERWHLSRAVFAILCFGG